MDGWDDGQVDAYLARIGASRPSSPSAEAVATLMAAHVAAVPFENLSVHLQEPIHIDADSLHEKIVGRRRGGFCFELNGGFAALLTSLGFEVTLLAGRVHHDGVFGYPFDHMAPVVTVDGERLLVDVGFGRFAENPVDLDLRRDQHDRFGVFAVRATSAGDLDVLHDGETIYRLETRPRVRDDFRPSAWWHATSPQSPFTQSTTCSRVTPTGRVTLAGSRLIQTADDGTRTESDLPPDQLLDAYRTWFGIALDHVPPVLHPSPAHPSGD